MAVWTPQKCELAPAAGHTYAALTDGVNTFADDGKQRTFLHVKNGGASTFTITTQAVKTSKYDPDVGEVTISNDSMNVAAGAEAFIGPFADAFLNAGVVSVSDTVISGVTVAVLVMPEA
jgi:hypothetical protein